MQNKVLVAILRDAAQDARLLRMTACVLLEPVIARSAATKQSSFLLHRSRLWIASLRSQ
jgi:hypothetical protein